MGGGPSPNDWCPYGKGSYGRREWPGDTGEMLPQGEVLPEAPGPGTAPPLPRRCFQRGPGPPTPWPRLRVPSEPGQVGGLLGGPLRTCSRGFTNAALTQTKGRAGVLGDASTGGQSTSSEALVLLAAVSSVARARPPAAQAPEGSGAGVSEVGLCGYSLPRLVGVPRGREGTV